MEPEDLVGAEVIAVKNFRGYLVIVFDNGHEVEVAIPVRGEACDAIKESDH